MPSADGAPLRAAAPEEVADVLAYAMRFDERGKARRTGHEYATRLAADQLVQHLAACGFVVARGRPVAAPGQALAPGSSNGPEAP
jgi:hypothetical protein